LIDRDVDFADSGAVTETKLQVDIEYRLPNVVNQENVRFVIYDNLNTVVDSKQATSYTQLTDNKRRFFVVYSTLDNALSDSQLGGWDVRVEVYDNAGTYEYLSASNVFYVSDATATVSFENVAGHKIKVSGVCGLTPTENGILLVTKRNTWSAHPTNHDEMVQCVDVDATDPVRGC